ncbi:MAG: glycosyltransferase family 39 protein [Gaiellaceae bacterium]
MSSSATGKRPTATGAGKRLAQVARHCRRLAARLEALVSWRWAAPLLFAVSLGVYWLESIARPLAAGRDFEHYLLYYVEFWDRHPVLPAVLVARTPATPLVVGGLLELGGPAAEVVLGLLFAASVLAWTAVARSFGRLPAVLTAAALLAYPSYGMLFHELASDSLFAFTFSLWSLGFVRAARQPRARRFVVLGLGVALLALIRPANQVLLVAGLFPLVLPGSWRLRLRWTAVFVAAGVLPLAGWAVHNGLRYGTYAIIRGSGEGFPFNRAFVTDRIVSPDNGPASRELARAVRTDLLTEQPYRAYHVTLKEFFSAGSVREHEDLISLSDRVWGWDSNYSKLHDAGVEAVQKHPGTYARGVLDTLWHELTKRRYVPQPSSSGAASGVSNSETVVVGGRRLPAPTEGQPIPGTHQPDIYTTPDQRVRVVWTSPTQSKVVFRRPSDERRYEQTMSEVGELSGRIPWHGANGQLALRFNQITHRYPSPIWWLIAGMLLAAFRRPRGVQPLLVLVLLGMVVLVFTALALSAEVAYLIPFFPAIVALTMAGLVGEGGAPFRRPTLGTRARRSP